MSLTAASSQLQAAIAKHLDKLSTPYCWEKAQQEAYAHFQKLGLPSNKTEAYKYTPITSILTEKFDFGVPVKSMPSLTAIDNYLQSSMLLKSLEVYPIVLINGKLSREHSDASLKQNSFQVHTLQEACLEQLDPFIKHFEKYATSQLDAFAAINMALLEDGVCIYIPDNVVVDKPLCIYNLIDGATPGTVMHPRAFIYIGCNSKISFINQVVNLGKHASFANTVTDILLGEAAQVDYYTLQVEVGDSYQVNAINCYQASHSIFNNYTFTWDGSMIRNNLSIYIQASNALANMYGMYCLDKNQHVDNCTLVDHQQPHTQSNELYKGIITDSATSVFNGKIYVQPNAQKTNAFQANNNILLAEEATIHTKPQLEIWADDVKCSHGATIGQLDEAQLFYLQARGISSKAAKHMLLYAFINEVLDKISIPNLRAYLKENFGKHLNLLA